MQKNNTKKYMKIIVEWSIQVLKSYLILLSLLWLCENLNYRRKDGYLNFYGRKGTFHYFYFETSF